MMTSSKVAKNIEGLIYIIYMENNLAKFGYILIIYIYIYK
jgi:hypothetical protein